MKTKLIFIITTFTVTGFSQLAHAQCGGICNGDCNAGWGIDALSSNIDGMYNAAFGCTALQHNTSGNSNTATGAGALEFNNGNGNTAAGTDALATNTSGNSNTASGMNALFTNVTGSFNTANGRGALYKNNTGSDNTADGYQALFSNTGSFNAADGDIALYKNTTGGDNTASGYSALYNNTTGNGNIAIGAAAGYNLTTGSNNIDIGNFGVAGESGTIRIGALSTQTNTYIAGVNGVTVAGGVHVVIDSTGHLGSIVSSKRFKENVQPMNETSEAIFSLQPVTFRYKKELDPQGIRQFGLVAEEVERVNPDLVARDNQGRPYSVRYEAVNAMLLNEFLKARHTIVDQKKKLETLETTVARQQIGIEILTAKLKEQAAQIQKVSAQFEMNRSKSKVVVNEP
jgi:trimeric autotransporter adhesin